MATYYVDPSGNDSGTGAIDDPWKTWGKPFNDTVAAGDTVYFRGGVYLKDYATEVAAESGWFIGYGYRITKDGEEGNYINYYNYPGEVPILDCSLLRTEDLDASENNFGIRSLNMNYIRF